MEIHYRKLVGGIGGMYMSSLLHCSTEWGDIFPCSIDVNSLASLWIILFFAVYWIVYQSDKSQVMKWIFLRLFHKYLSQNSFCLSNLNVAVVINCCIDTYTFTGDITSSIKSNSTWYFSRTHAWHSDFFFKFTMKRLLIGWKSWDKINEKVEIK